jgi:hypothetical protein
VLRDTLHGRALAEEGMIGGRYAAEAKQHVIGSGQVAYPALPASSPWASDLVPAEPPLGYSVEEQAPVGEVFEIEKSLAKSDVGEGINSPPASPTKRLANSGDAQRGTGRRSSLPMRARRRRPRNARRTS